MKSRKMNRRRPVGGALAILVVAIAAATPAAAQSMAERANRGLVEVVTGNVNGTSLRMAEDLADVLDDGATRRVLPVVGKGSVQDIIDLKALRGIDLAIVQTDVLDRARARRLFPGIEGALSYVAKLYGEEFHLLARNDVRSISDLAGKKVNFGPQLDGTAFTGPRVFELLRVKVEATSYSQALALEKLKSGEIAAMGFVVGKPATFFATLKPQDGLHFLSVPLKPEATTAYIPARLTAEDYPGLIPPHAAVDTVAVGMVLVAANLVPESERYRNVAGFVEAFFTQFPRLLEAPRHPKWNEVNLAAELPNWRRFGPADNWIKRNGGTPVAINDDQMRDIFTKFVDERSKSSSGGTLTADQKNQLFDQFKRWQGEHLR